MSKIIQALLIAIFRKPVFLIGLIALAIFLCIARINNNKRMRRHQA